MGSVGMLFQNNIKRFLSYSTLNNMGYILLGFSFNNNLGNTAIYIYILSYSLMMFIFIAIIACYINKKTKCAPLFFNQLSLLKKHYPLLSFIFAINIFSMIGLPPLAGFWGKFYIILNIIQNINNFNSLFILFVIIFTSIISAYAYLVILKKIFFFSDLYSNNSYVTPVSKLDYLIIIFLLILSLLLFIKII
jgi:NADH-quinone oxidoreductase subunit N